jgi:Flp pilus assembly protein TadG
MKRCGERGTFTVWALCLCLILFLLGGIAVDVWRAFDARRTLTEIADTAARDGANNIDVRQRQLFNRTILDPTAARNATQQSITQNAGLDSVNITSESIQVDAATNQVHVEIHSNFSFFFLRMIPGASDQDIVARATAQPFEGP